MANGCTIQQIVFCPKPRRFFSPAVDSDPKPANCVLDALFPKQSDPAPFFFSGSPPARSDNPIVHDARFGEAVPLDPITIAGTGSGSVMNVCTRIRYGLLPAAIRIEGFDSRDRSCGIPAVA